MFKLNTVEVSGLDCPDQIVAMIKTIAAHMTVQPPPDYKAVVHLMPRSCGGTCNHNDHQININSRLFDSPNITIENMECWFREMVLTVFHEYRHAYQCEHGLFIDYMIDGQRKCRDLGLDYKAWPQEQDAEGYALETFKKFRASRDYQVMLQQFKLTHFPADYMI